MVKIEKMPGYESFHLAAEVWMALHPESKRFNSGVARKIYPFLDIAFSLGLLHGASEDERGRKRILRRYAKYIAKLAPPAPEA